MAPSVPHAAMLLAPGASSGAALQFPSHDQVLPAVDDRLVEPCTREEILDGRRIKAMPAHEPHAVLHIGLGAVLQAHVVQGWAAAIDMLTRSAPDSDFAPDASVYPAERDPVTGGRQLEELAFEIVDKQSLSVATRKAAILAGRGVRRVFCIVLKTHGVYEWCADTQAWLPLSGALSDRCFVRDIPINALLDASAVDAAIDEARLARRSPVLQRALADESARGEARGEAHGMAKALLEVLTARGFAVDGGTRARVESCQDTATLSRWIVRAATSATADVVFADG